MYAYHNPPGDSRFYLEVWYTTVECLNYRDAIGRSLTLHL